MLCWNIVLFNFLAFFPIHLKQPRHKYLCRWANLYLLLHWSARKMCIPNASIHNVFLTCSYSVLLFCFSLGRKDKFRRNNRCVKSGYMYQETSTNLMWRRQQYTIHFTGMCFMTLSIFCQIYLFISYNSQRSPITVDVWYFTLVNHVHIAVHDK